MDQPAASRSNHPRGHQVEERRSYLSCECQFLIGSCIFPEFYESPRARHAPMVSVPPSRPVAPFQLVIRQPSFVKRKPQPPSSCEVRFTIHKRRWLLGSHDTAQIKGMPAPMISSMPGQAEGLGARRFTGNFRSLQASRPPSRGRTRWTPFFLSSNAVRALETSFGQEQ